MVLEYCLPCPRFKAFYSASEKIILIFIVILLFTFLYKEKLLPMLVFEVWNFKLMSILKLDTLSEILSSISKTQFNPGTF
jgi:hypothetical protein